MLKNGVLDYLYVCVHTDYTILLNTNLYVLYTHEPRIQEKDTDKFSETAVWTSGAKEDSCILMPISHQTYFLIII